MHTAFSRSFIVLTILGATGCKEYFSVEEACHPEGKFRGMDSLKGEDVVAVDYMNCHRRIIGFDRFGVADELALESQNVFDYVLANPEILGPTGSAGKFLVQEGSRPAFTGTEIFERIAAVDYQINDATITKVEEVIGVLPNVEYLGRDSVEFAMKVHWVQESILTPSTYDMGYAGGLVPAEWWASSGYTNPDGSVPTTGSFFYIVIISQTPPLEGASDTPVVYPKRDQVGVPLNGIEVVDRYQPDLNLNGVLEPDEIFSLSYPIMVGYTSALNPTATSYDLDILSATIQGPGGPLNTVWASPQESEPANHRLDFDGLRSEWAGGVYATEPFEPNTPYTLYVDISTVDGPVSHNVSFTTAAQDPLYFGADAVSRSKPTTKHVMSPLAFGRRVATP